MVYISLSFFNRKKTGLSQIVNPGIWKWTLKNASVNRILCHLAKCKLRWIRLPIISIILKERYSELIVCFTWIGSLSICVCSAIFYPTDSIMASFSYGLFLIWKNQSLGKWKSSLSKLNLSVFDAAPSWPTEQSGGLVNLILLTMVGKLVVLYT